MAPLAGSKKRSCASLEATIKVVDTQSRQLQAVVPIELVVSDPDGRTAEFSGHYGARDGLLNVKLDIAANDTPGLWQIRARELASRLEGTRYFRVE